MNPPSVNPKTRPFPAITSLDAFCRAAVEIPGFLAHQEHRFRPDAWERLIAVVERFKQTAKP